METNYPTQFIVFGGSGDLAKRKLIPALLDLYKRGKLPERFNIIGLARTPRTDAEYQAFVRGAIDEHEHNHTDEEVTDFCSNFCYVAGSFDENESYAGIKKRLEEFDTGIGQCTNKLFYLAVAPDFYGTIFEKLAESDVAKECGEEGGWSRILVEKPFGTDLKSAQELDAKLASLFREEQIFRIDHYLAKEAVQNILSFRFANRLFNAAWSREHVKRVEVVIKETIDVDGRGSFYDGMGALRDVGQNHLLQLLALVAMEEPESFTSEAVRSARGKVLGDLQMMNAGDIKDNVVRGQYSGYTQVQGVSEESDTETFFDIRAHIQNDRWKDVPFYLKAGKALDEAKVSVTIHFKPNAEMLFEERAADRAGNSVELRVSPKQEIHVGILAKRPGLAFTLEDRNLSFVCDAAESEIKNSYEKVLLDCIHGDQTLFTSTKEVVAAWSFITSILENWHEIPLQTYEKGSSGPELLLRNSKTV